MKIEDAVIRGLQKQAAEEGRSFQEVANRLLTRGLATSGPTSYKLALKGWAATLQPGADILDQDKPVRCDGWPLVRDDQFAVSRASFRFHFVTLPPPLSTEMVGFFRKSGDLGKGLRTKEHTGE